MFDRMCATTRTLRSLDIKMTMSQLTCLELVYINGKYKSVDGVYNFHCTEGRTLSLTAEMN